MRRRLETHVTLIKIPTPLTETAVRDALRGCAAGRARGEFGKEAVGIIVDPGMMGEPVTAPHIRLCPMNTTVTKAT